MHRITVEFRSDATPAERIAALSCLRRVPGVRTLNLHVGDGGTSGEQHYATVLVDDVAASQWFVPELARLRAVASARI